MFLQDSTLLQQTSEAAHQEPLVRIRAPALVWQRSFLVTRRPGEQSVYRSQPQQFAEERYTLDEIKDQFDNMLVALLRTLKKVPSLSFKVFPYADKINILFKTLLRDDDELTDVSALAPMLARVLEAGERTVSIVLQGWEEAGTTWRIDMRFQVLTNLFNLLVVATPAESSLLTVENARDFRRATSWFWPRFIARLRKLGTLRQALGRAQLRSYLYPKAGPPAPSIFDNDFADVRGVIVPFSSLKFEERLFIPGDRLPDWGSVATKYRSVIDPGDRNDCAATFMLDRRALHMSDLGPQPLASTKRRPVTFLLFVMSHEAGEDGVGERQLGRLVDRLLWLETMRLAALLDIRWLQLAGIKLSAIDTAKQQAREKMRLYESESLKADETRSALKRLRGQMNEISDGFLAKNSAGVGLTFRIESARYYISQFESNLAALRVGRIEGFQSYERFVERRLGVRFEAIDRLGIRYDRALNEMSAIDQSFQSIQARHTGAAVAVIQRWGELILITTLVPYYVISTIDHLLEAEHGEPKALHRLVDRIGFGKNSEEVLFLLIWVAFILSGIARFVTGERAGWLKAVSGFLALAGLYATWVGAQWLFS